MFDTADLKKKFGPRARVIITIGGYNFTDYMTAKGEADALAWAIAHTDPPIKTGVHRALIEEAAANDREGFIVIYPPLSDYVYLIHVQACSVFEEELHFLLKQYRIETYLPDVFIDDEDILDAEGDEDERDPWVWAIDSHFNYASDAIMDALIKLRKNSTVFM